MTAETIHNCDECGRPRSVPGVRVVTAEVALAQVAIVTDHARHVADDQTACDGARRLAEAMVLAMDVLAGVLADRPVPLAPVMPLPTRIVPGRRPDRGRSVGSQRQRRTR